MKTEIHRVGVSVGVSLFFIFYIAVWLIGVSAKVQKLEQRVQALENRIGK